MAEMLTTDAALDEVLDRVFGGWGEDWRERLARADVDGTPDDAVAANGLLTYGDLRRWAAPLLSR